MDCHTVSTAAPWQRPLSPSPGLLEPLLAGAWASPMRWEAEACVLDLNPGFASYQLCDLEQVMSPQ